MACGDATGAHVEALARFMAEHYREQLSIGQIAQAVDLHPNYAMQLFRARCGMNMWEHVMRLRISHAQCLLLATDWKVRRIAVESGFASSSRFYAAFGRVTQCTPIEYRSQYHAASGEALRQPPGAQRPAGQRGMSGADRRSLPTTAPRPAFTRLRLDFTP